LPLICAAWPPGEDLWAFLETELANPVSALLVSAERSLAAELPDSANARDVLSAIGSGERTFTNIARAAGGIAHASLTRAIDALAAKRIVVGELPVWTRPSKERRYRVTDPYLRFWLRFIGPRLPEIERLRGDLTLQRIRDSWTAWRGRAVEPLARESLARLLPDGRLPAASAVGAYWNRSSTIEFVPCPSPCGHAWLGVDRFAVSCRVVLGGEDQVDAGDPGRVAVTHGGGQARLVCRTGGSSGHRRSRFPRAAPARHDRGG
jgi:hypothetical protein